MKFLDCFVPRNDAKQQWERSPVGAQDIKQAVKHSGTPVTYDAAIDPSHPSGQCRDDMAATSPVGAQDIKQAVKPSGTPATHTAAIDPTPPHMSAQG